jgi:hypothetical protein
VKSDEAIAAALHVKPPLKKRGRAKKARKKGQFPYDWNHGYPVSEIW